jgi:hypothetical protein
MGGVRGKKKIPVATLAFAAIMSSGSFFSLLSSCHVLGVCWLRQGFRWPYRRTCGFFARHACGSKLIPPPALFVSMSVFLSYLAGSSGVSHITHQGAHDVPLSAVSIVLNRFYPFRVRAFSNF